MSRVLIFLKWLACFCFLALQQPFLVWTRPRKHSLLLGAVTDFFRSKSQVVAEQVLFALVFLFRPAEKNRRNHHLP